MFTPPGLPCATAPEAYRTVPSATLSPSLPFEEFLLSYTKSSITNLLFSVILTVVLSTNVILNLP